MSSPIYVIHTKQFGDIFSNSKKLEEEILKVNLLVAYFQAIKTRQMRNSEIATSLLGNETLFP